MIMMGILFVTGLSSGLHWNRARLYISYVLPATTLPMRTLNLLIATLLVSVVPVSAFAQDISLPHNEHHFAKEEEPCVEDEDGKRCTTLDLSWITFDDLPVLTDSITASVKGVLVDDEQPDMTGTLDELADAWFSRLREEAAEDTLTPPDAWVWRIQDSIVVHDRRGNLLTLHEESYTDTGGAHGLPYTSYLHWDVGNDQEVILDDLLVNGREEAFWTLAREAHRRWAQEYDLTQDDLENWPFEQTDEFYFDDDGLVLVYQVYDIAPYALGQPELEIPWGELRGIIKPAYLP